MVYTDLGLSGGMNLGIEHALSIGREVEYRKLGFIPEVTNEEVALEEAYIRAQEDFRMVLNHTQEVFTQLTESAALRP